MGKKEKIIEIPIVRKVLDKTTGDYTEEDDILRIVKPDLGGWVKFMAITEDSQCEPLKELGIPFLIYLVILSRVKWIDGTFDLVPALKKAITEVTGIKEGMIMKYITRFCEASITRQIKGVSYMVNPQYVFKGYEDDQIRLIKKFHDLVWIKCIKTQQ